MSRLTTLSLVLAILTATSLAWAGEAVAVTDPRLENVHRITANVLAGAEPHGEAAFAALKELGVKTIITVDGAKPDVEMAKKYGLRYVHLPIGYDGVPLARGQEIGKALQELDGPFYIHCHHGMHRGPAAAVVGCVVSGLISNDDAVADLKLFGTGENYLGLWEAARNAKPASAEQLKALQVEYREISPIPPLADAMVSADQAMDQIGDCKKADWKTPKEHPDLDPAHEALKLHEIMYETTRTEEYKQRPADFRDFMEKCIEDSKRLETLLRKAKAAPADVPAADLDGAFSNLDKDCKSCHKIYRNVKKKE